MGHSFLSPAFFLLETLDNSERESDLSSLLLREEVRGGERCGILKVVQLLGYQACPRDNLGMSVGSVHSTVAVHSCPRGATLSAPT